MKIVIGLKFLFVGDIKNSVVTIEITTLKFLKIKTSVYQSPKLTTLYSSKTAFIVFDVYTRGVA